MAHTQKSVDNPQPHCLTKISDRNGKDSKRIATTSVY